MTAVANSNYQMYLMSYILLAAMNIAEPYAVHAVAAPFISLAGLYGSYLWLQGHVIDPRLAEDALYYTVTAIIVHVVYRISRHGVETRHMAALWIANQAIQSGEAAMLMPCLLGGVPYALRAYGFLSKLGFRWLYAGTCVGWPATVLLLSRMSASGCAVLAVGTALAALEFTRII